MSGSVLPSSRRSRCSASPSASSGRARSRRFLGGPMLTYLAVEGAEHDINPLIPVWQEIVLGLVAFGILCFVLMKFVFPQMEKTFAARVDAIEGGIKRAEAAQ